MEGVTAIITLGISILALLLTVVYTRRYKHLERLSMIEKGVDPATYLTKKQNTFLLLRLALLVTGAGLGLFLGYILDMALGMEEVAYFSMLLICGGLGLLLAYKLENKDEQPT